MIQIFRIQNKNGSYIEVSNYGATLTSVVVPDQSGKLGNVILNYNNPEDYLHDKYYLGSTVGRVANRISNARFELNGKTYYLDKNDGRNSNHGGFNGINTRYFDYRRENNKIVFSYLSKDGEGGFPGNLQLCVTYSFSEDNMLTIEYKASCDKPTPVNFTNHSYFNLSENKRPILDNLLQVNATEYLESDNEFLPTGKILPVAGTAFDFRAYKEIGKMLPLKKDNLEGYNAFFQKDRGYNEDIPLASLKNKTSGRIVDMYTSMPGVLIYTGDFLADGFRPFEGICLEAQYHPDGINQPDFVSNILPPGEIKTDTIIYHFRTLAIGS